jgi:hypothetical protein
VDPAAIGAEMGLPEATIRSWLGHLRQARYVDAHRLNGHVRVTIRTVHLPTSPVHPSTPSTPPLSRFFTAQKLEEALGETGQRESLEAALNLHLDSVIRRALAGALAVPGPQIRRSRTALFLYLLKRYAHETHQ